MAIGVLGKLIKLHGLYKNKPGLLGGIDESVVETLSRIIFEVVETIEVWLKKVQRKMDGVAKGNKHLRDLPIHERMTRFYAKVSEFNAEATLVLRHPLNEVQKKRVRSAKDEDLMRYNLKDPIMGRREFREDDDFRFPGSRIILTQGTHRTYELYRRYLQERINGNMLVEFVIDMKDY
ncbi:MAG TPA: hypothetical protein VFE88_02945 [Candidatus Nanoarchaeia archaeon]|nr:hypothetical protein [Candidatus Nanoarchaeia archaeon]